MSHLGALGHFQKQHYLNNLHLNVKIVFLSRMDRDKKEKVILLTDGLCSLFLCILPYL